MNIDDLNEWQQEVVTTIDGPILVLAGAGSGKTRVLTKRVAYLINECNINPYNILAITFTNKAAKEMRERIVRMLGLTTFSMQISTFHSLGLLIVRENYELLHFKKNFTIIDSDDSLSVIKRIMKDLNLDISQYNPKAIKNQISGAKNELMEPNEYEKFANTEFEQKVLEIYKYYQERLRINNSVDFDDLLLLPIKLFVSHPEVLKKYQERFQYILVDEYQDTNEAQYKLIKMLSARYKNICVVGDNDQSIYSFRGANYHNILNFEHDYPHPKIVMLEKNYRSTKNILNAANDVIKNNKERKDKNLWTDNEEGVKIVYHRSFDEKDEAYYAVNQIKKLLADGIKHTDIAVLYRTNAQSRNMEDVLLHEGIPYKVIGSFYFYNRKEIKDLIAYLKLIYNQDDDLNLQRIINVPKRGIGNVTMQNLITKANLEHKSVYECINSGKELIFKEVMDYLIKESEHSSLTELVELILEKTGMRKELLSEKTIEADVRLENMEEFKSITRAFEEKNGIISLEDFLAEISLVSDVEEYKDNSETITLMTVHSAKGLEFDNVFLIGMEEGLFPHNNSLFSSEEIEEERRICYVAITRSKKRLWLVNAKRRTIYGQDSCNPPSRFVDEISRDYLELDNEIVENKKENPKYTIDTAIDYKIGDRVIHDIHGEGIVVGIEERLITVAFAHPDGIKKLIKGHGSYRKV